MSYLKSLKRILALLLVLSICLSAMPVHAHENSVGELIEEDFGSSTFQNSAMVASGYLEVNPDGSVRITEKYVQYIYEHMGEGSVAVSVSADRNTLVIAEEDTRFHTDASKRASGGVTKIEWTSPFTFKLYLDNATSNFIKDGLGGLAILSNCIPDPIIVRAVSALLAANYFTIAICNAKQRGVIIYFAIFMYPFVTARIYWMKSK